MNRTILAVAVFCVLWFVADSTCVAAPVIFGCVAKDTGLLRIVSSPEKCARYENPISWDTTASPEPQEPQGVPEPAGPSGSAEPLTSQALNPSVPWLFFSGVHSAAFARVDTPGTIIVGTNVLSVDHPFQGIYEVKFPVKLFKDPGPVCVVSGEELLGTVLCKPMLYSPVKVEVWCTSSTDINVLNSSPFAIVCLQ